MTEAKSVNEKDKCCECECFLLEQEEKLYTSSHLVNKWNRKR